MSRDRNVAEYPDLPDLSIQIFIDISFALHRKWHRSSAYLSLQSNIERESKNRDDTKYTNQVLEVVTGVVVLDRWCETMRLRSTATGTSILTMMSSLTLNSRVCLSFSRRSAASVARTSTHVPVLRKYRHSLRWLQIADCCLQTDGVSLTLKDKPNRSMQLFSTTTTNADPGGATCAYSLYGDELSSNAASAFGGLKYYNTNMDDRFRVLFVLGGPGKSEKNG